MLTSLIHLAPFAAILAGLYVVLAMNVIRLRKHYQLSLGINAEDQMLRAVRAHANFAEYVPFSLVMLALVALLGGATLLMILLGFLLVIGRVAHAYSLLIYETSCASYRWRMVGMVLSFSVLLISAGFLLMQWLAFTL